MLEQGQANGMRQRMLLRLGALCLTIFTLAAAGFSQQPAHKTVLDGAYTADQAARGETAFLTICSDCHAEDLNGSPPLKGPVFMDNWREDTLDRLFTYMKTTMPRDGRRFSDEIYLDILAYILQANSFPPGAMELTVASVENVQL